jgi:hypothetical protein
MPNVQGALQKAEICRASPFARFSSSSDRPMNFRPRLFPAFVPLLAAFSVHAGEVKVDINRDTKNSAAETEVGYVKWSQDSTGGASSGLTPVTKSFTSSTGETVTVSFVQTALSQSRGGTGLLSNWYQIGAQGAAKLVSDGLTVAPANLGAGGQMQMTITGLAAGHHTLLTYHNAWDALAAGSLGPMDIFLNGTQVVDNLQPTIRAATNALAPVAYLEFDVAGPADVTTVLFAAETSGAQAIKNVMVNGFEIDTPNSTRIANTPSPADGDEHVNADSGGATLSWSPATAGSAVSHDVYLGTSFTAVKNATHTSAEFKGNQSGLTYPATGLNSALTYYWRVDEIDSVGNATKGTVWYFRPRHLAFPDAEGYGRFARGGRGGVVIEVTNLNDSGPGSLRDALTGNYGPRTVVFTVSGLITLESALTVSQPYITLAGQTAPGKGICVRKYALGWSGAKDNIIRHVRSRPGNIAGVTLNGSGMAGCDHTIMDHCSISWGIDEEMSTRSSKNVTLQRTLISEALNIAGHQNYPAGTAHGYAASVGGDIASLHHNLLAHNEGRNWSLAGGLDGAGYFAGRLDIFNNVVYNWGNRTTDGGAMEVNFVNNYYRPGAATTYLFALNAQYDNFPGTQRYYIAGNVMPGRFTATQNTLGLAYTQTASNGGSLPGYQNFMPSAFFPSYATIHTAADAFKIVLSDVGCSQPMLDDHDARVIRETRDGTYSYTGTGPYGGAPGLPNSQDDVGGWENYFTLSRPVAWDTDHDGLPDWWENLAGSNPNSPAGNFSDSNADPDNDGYTALENYLNWLAAPFISTATNTPLVVELAPFAGGFTGAAFSVSGAIGGSVALQADGHSALFTPANGFNGFAGFNFTISGGGTIATRSAGIVVSAQEIFERRWRGAATGNVWSATSALWLAGSVLTAFQPGNGVVFDDAGAANSAITLSGVLQPSGITVSGATNYTFNGSGTLAVPGALVKNGTGTLTLGGGHSFGSVLVESGSLVITSGAFTATGSVTNNGTLRLTGGAALNVSGPFVNNSVLDLMTGAQALPAGFINNGTVLDSSLVRVNAISKSGANISVSIVGYAGHSYQLEKADSPAGSWTPVGAVQPGAGSVLTFTDSGATGGQKFYRVAVAP